MLIVKPFKTFCCLNPLVNMANLCEKAHLALAHIGSFYYLQVMWYAYYRYFFLFILLVINVVSCKQFVTDWVEYLCLIRLASTFMTKWHISH